MGLRDILQTGIGTCGADDLLSTAAEEMEKSDAKVVVVIGELGRPVSLLTEHDVVSAANRLGGLMGEIRVWEAMPQGLQTARIDDDPRRLERAMLRAKRALALIVDREGKPIGVVSSKALGDTNRSTGPEPAKPGH